LDYFSRFFKDNQPATNDDIEMVSFKGADPGEVRSDSHLTLTKRSPAEEIVDNREKEAAKHVKDQERGDADSDLLSEYSVPPPPDHASLRLQQVPSSRHLQGEEQENRTWNLVEQLAKTSFTISENGDISTSEGVPIGSVRNGRIKMEAGTVDDHIRMLKEAGIPGVTVLPVGDPNSIKLQDRMNRELMANNRSAAIFPDARGSDPRPASPSPSLEPASISPSPKAASTPSGNEMPVGAPRTSRLARQVAVAEPRRPRR
jgi:hypothetical protein